MKSAFGNALSVFVWARACVVPFVPCVGTKNVKGQPCNGKAHKEANERIKICHELGDPEMGGEEGRLIGLVAMLRGDHFDGHLHFHTVAEM